jgi:uncharacterized protein (UPF0303 family)
VTYTVESLAAELKALELDRFDYEFAWRLGATIRDLADQRRLPVGITVGHGADLVFATLMPGATPDNIAWTARKRAVAHRFHRSSLSMRLAAEASGVDFNKRFRLPEADFAASGGGVPLIERNGTLVGTVAVSGLPDVEDHGLVIEALRLILDRPEP